MEMFQRYTHTNPCTNMWKECLSVSFSVLLRSTVTPYNWLPVIHEYEWVSVESLSRVQLFATTWTVAYQAPQCMKFSRQEYWSGLPFPSPGDLPHPGIEPRSPTLQADALLSEPPGNFYGPHWLYSPWNSPGQNTGMGISFLQGIFPTEVSCIAGRFFTSWATREAQNPREEGSHTMKEPGIPSDHIENFWSIRHYLSKNKISIILIHGGWEVHLFLELVVL